MKRKISGFIFIIQISMSCFAFESIAFNDFEAGAYLWKLINEARARPAKTIEIYGIDYESAKLALDQDVWILELENGLPPLAWNKLLEDSSSSHSHDMIDRQYYSYTSIEGLSFNDRIVNSGYAPISTGESLGILSFYIYVDPIKAVEAIFENMLRDELNPLLGYPKNIFNKDFTEIGISFISTLFAISPDLTLNAYLVTADFAKPLEPRSYIIGNIYNFAVNQPIISDNIDDEDNYAAKLLNNKSWSPEKANNNFILWVSNFTENWTFEVSHGYLGTYQIEMPPNTFYSIELYKTDENSQAEQNLIKRIVSIGTNINKMVDIKIE